MRMHDPTFFLKKGKAKQGAQHGATQKKQGGYINPVGYFVLLCVKSLYLTVWLDCGRLCYMNNKERVSVYMEQWLAQRLKSLADEEERSVSSMIIRILKVYLEKEAR